MTPQVIHIRSENADFQLLEAIGRNREKRRKYGLFMLEGVRPINLALLHGWEFDALIVPEGASHSRWAHEVIARANAERHFVIAKQGFDLLAERAEGTELLALVRIRAATINPAPDLRVVLLDRPGNPGNLGSIVRSCDAFGFHGVALVGHGVDPFSREAIRASTGSLLAVPVVHFPGPREVQGWLDDLRRALGSVRLIGSDEHGDLEARKFDFAGPLVLAAGNETHGLSAALRELCDMTLRIPITGSASSLNVAAATSILLYECSLHGSGTGQAALG